MQFSFQILEHTNLKQPLDKPIYEQHNWPPQNAMLHKKRKDLEALAFAHSLHVGDYIKRIFYYHSMYCTNPQYNSCPQRTTNFSQFLINFVIKMFVILQQNQEQGFRIDNLGI